MKLRRLGATAAATIALTGGGTVVIDQAVINPYTDRGTTLEITASSTLPEGGSQRLVADKTKPKITLEKWNGEIALGVQYQGMTASGGRPFLSKNVEWKQGQQTMQAVPLEATRTMEDGG